MAWSGEQSSSSLDVAYLSDVTESEDDEMLDGEPLENLESVACGEIEDPIAIHRAHEIAKAFAPVVRASLGWVHSSSCWLFSHNSIAESQYKLVACISGYHLASTAKRVHQNCADLKLPIAGAKILASEDCLLIIYLEATASPCQRDILGVFDSLELADFVPFGAAPQEDERDVWVGLSEDNGSSYIGYEDWAKWMASTAEHEGKALGDLPFVSDRPTLFGAAVFHP